MNNRYVYELIDPRTNAVFYVGKGVDDRMFEHERNVRNHKHDTNYKKGKIIKEIISSNNKIIYRKVYENLLDEDALIKEEELINIHGLSNLTNIAPRGYSSDNFTNNPNKEIIRKKLSDAQKGKTYIEKYGEKRALEILEKKRKSMLGKTKTQECKNKIRDSITKYYVNNPEFNRGKNNGNYGKKHPGLNSGHTLSDDARHKISIKAKSRLRKPHTEETKLKIKLSNIGKHKMSEKGKEAIRESNRKRRKIKNNM